MTKSCPVYKKFFQAMADTPVDIRHIVADSMCRQASKYNIPDTLSAEEIGVAIRTKQAAQDKQVPQSKEENPKGVKDKKYPQSALGDDYESCLKSLGDLGIDPDRAKTECETQWKGQNTRVGTVSGKTKKAVLARLAKYYPNLSKESRENIVSQVIKEASQIRQASVENETPVEVPYWVLATDIDTSHLADAIPKDSGHLKSASLDQRKQYFDAIHEPITDVLRNRAVNRDERARIKSANVKKETDDKKPAWARACDL